MGLSCIMKFHTRSSKVQRCKQFGVHVLLTTKTTKLHENKNNVSRSFVGLVTIINNCYSDTSTAAGRKGDQFDPKRDLRLAKSQMRDSGYASNLNSSSCPLTCGTGDMSWHGPTYEGITIAGYPFQK